MSDLKTTPNRRRGWQLLAIVFALLLLGVSACGSDTNKSASSESDGGQEQSWTMPADAADRLDELSSRPEQILVTEPVGEPIPQDIRLAAGICPAPSCQNMGNAIKRAVEALGWTFIEVPAELTPEGTKNSWEQMLRQDPDAIINLSQPRAYFEAELKRAVEKDIPVVSILVADSEAGNGVDYVVYGPSELEMVGSELAQWVVNDGNGKGKALVVNIPQIPLLDGIAQAFTKEYESFCDECEAIALDVPFTSLGNDLTTRVVGALRANPDVTHVMAGYQDMVQGLPAALRAAGLDEVRVVANGGLEPDVAAYLQEGKPMVGFYAYAGTQATWRGIDWLARHFAGASTEPAENAGAEAWFVLPEATPDGGAPNLVENFESQFKQLWGVG